MPSSPFYDFSAESDIKESLFEDMQKIHESSKRQAAPSREPVSFGELARGRLRPGQTPPTKTHNFDKPAPEKDFEKS